MAKKHVNRYLSKKKKKRDIKICILKYREIVIMKIKLHLIHKACVRIGQISVYCIPGPTNVFQSELWIWAMEWIKKK